MTNNVIFFPDERARLVEEQRKRALVTSWRRYMLVGRKCEIINHLYGSPDCPSDLSHLETMIGVVISGPHFEESSNSSHYSILVVLENGRLFKSNSDKVKLTDYMICPF